jgi:uncharacterized protein (TIGR02145 family)
MKKLTAAFFLFCIMTMMGCGKGQQEEVDNLKQQVTGLQNEMTGLQNEMTRLKRIVDSLTAVEGIFTDSRDNQTYSWVLLDDGKRWMSENLNYETADSWCYDNNDDNCGLYGRLYTWKAALNACPRGWRLPTDSELQKMVKYYGGFYDGASGSGKAAYKALYKGGSSGFNALLGGNRYSNGGFRGLDEGGYYWSSTEYVSSYAWYYYFNGYSQNLLRYSGYKGFGFSCRCLQD